MARPQNLQTLDGAQSTGAGDRHRQQGYPNATLVVVAHNLDATNDTLTVDLEHSPRGQKWEAIGSVSEGDFDGEVASVRLSEVALEHLRATVADLTDAADGDLAIDAYLLLNGNPGSAYGGREA